MRFTLRRNSLNCIGGQVFVVANGLARLAIAVELSSDSTGVWKFHDLVEQNDLLRNEVEFGPCRIRREAEQLSYRREDFLIPLITD